MLWSICMCERACLHFLTTTFSLILVIYSYVYLTFHQISFMCHEFYLYFMSPAFVWACMCLCICGYLSWRTGDAVRMWVIMLCIVNHFSEPMFPVYADRTNVSTLAALCCLRQHTESEKPCVLPQMFWVCVDCNKQTVALGTIFSAYGILRILCFRHAL